MCSTNHNSITNVSTNSNVGTNNNVGTDLNEANSYEANIIRRINEIDPIDILDKYLFRPDLPCPEYINYSHQYSNKYNNYAKQKLEFMENIINLYMIIIMLIIN